MTKRGVSIEAIQTTMSVNCNLRTEYCNNIMGVCGQYVLGADSFMNRNEDFMKKIFHKYIFGFLFLLLG